MAALNAGYSVTSLSRSGRLTNTTGIPLSAVSQIQWRKADVFDPETYKEQLAKSDAVVHTMGTIFDDPSYKDTVNGPSDIGGVVDLIRKRLKGRNPMENGSVNNFTRLNRDSALILANELAKTGDSKSFVYVSAADWNPLADSQYIKSKRDAEDKLELISGLRTVFIRPGFMYDINDQSSFRGKLGAVASLTENLAKLTKMDCVSSKLPSISVQIVAQAIVESLNDESIEGAVELDALQKYAASF